ncbi:hypothetical protein GTY58_38545 [Streptomyces sp. SID5469]|nr:hypothetical protein [Streptomyces sp. SID5469]
MVCAVTTLHLLSGASGTVGTSCTSGTSGTSSTSGTCVPVVCRSSPRRRFGQTSPPLHRGS